MYAPFSAGSGTYYGPLKNVTSVCRAMLSKGSVFYLAVFCIIAVKKDIGLNNNEICKDFGVSKVVDHC